MQQAANVATVRQHRVLSQMTLRFKVLRVTMQPVGRIGRWRASLANASVLLQFFELTWHLG